MTATTPLLAVPALAPGWPGDDNQWLTRSPRPKPGAAPWERGLTTIDPDEAEDADPLRDDPAPAQHSDGITVADLIAKVSGTRPELPEEPARHRAEPRPARARAARPTARAATSPPVVPAYSEPHAAARRTAIPPPRSFPRFDALDSELPILSDARRTPARHRHRAGPQQAGLAITADARPWSSAGWPPH